MIYSLYDLVMLIFLSTLAMSVMLIVIIYLVFRRVLISPSSTLEGKIVTVLRCPLCNYAVRRTFKLGDYVGKVDSEVCPSHRVNLVVYEIFREASEE